MPVRISDASCVAVGERVPELLGAAAVVKIVGLYGRLHLRPIHALEIPFIDYVHGVAPELCYCKGEFPVTRF
jgi:hypothetical protein